MFHIYKEEYITEFTEEIKDLLIPYYEGKDEFQIKNFIKEKCYMKL